MSAADCQPDSPLFAQLADEWRICRRTFDALSSESAFTDGAFLSDYKTAYHGLRRDTSARMEDFLPALHELAALHQRALSLTQALREAHGLNNHAEPSVARDYPGHAETVATALRRLLDRMATARASISPHADAEARRRLDTGFADFAATASDILQNLHHAAAIARQLPPTESPVEAPDNTAAPPSDTNEMTLHAYPAYKDSGVPWLGRVPAHWEVKEFRRCLIANDGGVWGADASETPSDTVVLRSTEQTVDGRWCIEEPAVRLLSEKERHGSLLLEGDLLITKSSGSELHIGKTTLVDANVASISACYSNFMQRLRGDEGTVPKFLWYITNSQIARAQFGYLSDSTTGLANLTATTIGQLIVPLPPLAEQRAIAAWLDERTGRIDEAVAAQRTLLEQLKEKRRALIAHAVTRGLDPAAPLKDSGLEWLGMVPAHWEVKKLGMVSKLKGGAGFPDEYQGELENEVPFFKVGDLSSADGDGVMRLANHTVTQETAKSLRATIFPSGTIVFAKVGAALLLKRFRKLGQHSCIDNNMMGMTVDADYSTDYLLYVLPLLDFALIVNPGAVPSINGSQISSQLISLPPLAEQQAIAAYLDTETAKLDTLTAETERTIALLQEHRTALIAEAVTGKLRVPGV